MTASLRAAVIPTMYFVGVSTSESLIMRVFARWRELLTLGPCHLEGVDLPLHAPPADFRAVVDHIAGDPMSLGALVTTHKLDLFAACRDRFAVVDEFAALMRETSSLSKRDGALVCHAKDPISSSLAMEAFIPTRYFGQTGAHAFVIGAGGAATAITWALARRDEPKDSPRRIVVSDVDPGRLDALGDVLRRGGAPLPVELVHCGSAADNDAVVAGLPAGSLVVNATGLGKDAPGSPLSGRVPFPERGLVWELNYRGRLEFLRQAGEQAKARDLHVEDGWTYFIHGWTQVIAEVFRRPIATAGSEFDQLVMAAEAARDAAS